MEFNLVPFYQPIYDCWTNNVIGYESTTKGEINGEILKFAELYEKVSKSGQGDKLDRLARDKSILEFLENIKGDERIFVNLSPLSSEDSWFLEDNIQNVKQVVLEITETHTFSVTERIKNRIKFLRQQGMQVALDDFGVGSNNFNLIYELEPEFIKLDKYFVTTIDSTYGKNLIRGLLEFTKKSNITMIVEGIETDKQKEILLDLGVRYMQGFHLGEPDNLSKYINEGI